MNINEALNLLNISDKATKEEIRNKYGSHFQNAADGANYKLAAAA